MEPPSQCVYQFSSVLVLHTERPRRLHLGRWADSKISLPKRHQWPDNVLPPSITANVPRSMFLGKLAMSGLFWKRLVIIMRVCTLPQHFHSGTVGRNVQRVLLQPKWAAAAAAAAHVLRLSTSDALICDDRRHRVVVLGTLASRCHATCSGCQNHTLAGPFICMSRQVTVLSAATHHSNRTRHVHFGIACPEILWMVKLFLPKRP